MFRFFNKRLTPDEVYATNLEVLGLGYPLWCPEPHDSGELHLADVGFLHEGKFIRLFNLDLSSPDKAVTHFKPPFTNIVALPQNALQINRTVNLLSAGHYCSRGVRESAAHASAAAPAGPNVSVAFKADYTCHEAQGAALTLQSQATAEVILPSADLKDYILQHVVTWHEYATQVLRLGIKIEDIVVVTGWVKTAPDWAATAFGFDKRAGASLSVGAHGAGAAGVDVGWSSSTSVKTSSIQRHGTLYSLHPSQPPATNLSRSQCIFIKRLSVRTRLILPKRIEGGAGFQGPPGSRRGHDNYGDRGRLAAIEGEDSNVEYGWQEYTQNERVDTALDIIQEYIFEVSDAKRALTSDDEVDCVLCGERVIDLASWLREARFEVVVNSNGVGSLRMEDVIRHQQERRFAHPPITTADRGEWPQIARRDAGNVTDSRIFLGPTQSKACPVQYMAIVFGNSQANDSTTDDSEKSYPDTDDSDTDDSEAGNINSSQCVALSTDGKLLAAATGNTITVWRLQDGLSVQRLERDGHTDTIKEIAFSPDGQHVVSGADDKLALVWDVKTGDIVHRLEGHEMPVWYAVFSPDGTQIATRSNDSELRMWCTSTGKLLHTNTELEHSGWSTEIRFSPDGSRLAACSDASREDTSVAILDCRTGERILTLRKRGILCMAFSPEGDQIATGSTDSSACVWDAASGKALLELKEHTALVEEVAFSPDGGEVATASNDGTVVTCDSRTGERRFKFCVESVRGEDKEAVYAVTYSPINEFIACGAADGCVRVWNRKTGAFVATFQGHTELVVRVMFTPDGWDILSYGTDGVVQLWSVRDALRLS
ncbi:WD40 repeat domain-containing protein [Phanerochaete sordida]|uniref:WD40 repeat domain-containing protein n=1 Tax=Phanerochaete sordida TaxID=48140 RepID=A0A9P3LME6_9APHY|nr:WD40 repeat domain-containing protein [Phanerochaete sordida]